MPLKGPMPIRVTLVSSPHELEQYADVLHPMNGLSTLATTDEQADIEILEVTCAGFLEFNLNEEERSGFRTIKNKVTGDWNYYFQYEVRFTVEYLWRHFEVVIPRTGLFPENWRLVGMNGQDADARLGPDPIKKGVPILRQIDQKDVEEDPKHIVEFQDRQLEGLRAWTARGPNGYWDTAPRDYPRPSKFRQTLSPSAFQDPVAKEPILHRPASPGGVRKKKKNKFRSCERCVRHRRKCQRPSVGDTCFACTEDGATCSFVSRTRDTLETAEKSE